MNRIGYRETKRYEILADPMRVLLELVFKNIGSGKLRCLPKSEKCCLTFSEICEKLKGIMTPDSVSRSIDILYDRQEISASSYIKNNRLVRGYAPATELIQETMTELFITTPFGNLG